MVSSSMNRQDDLVDQLGNFDLDRLMNDSWDNLGEEGQKALIDDCYKMLRYRYPGADELELYNYAGDFARQQSDLRLYNLAVEKNRPQNELEYLRRKIGDMNLLMNVSKGLAVSQAKTTGDMAAYEAANEGYRQDGHKFLTWQVRLQGLLLTLRHGCRQVSGALPPRAQCGSEVVSLPVEEHLQQSPKPPHVNSQLP